MVEPCKYLISGAFLSESAINNIISTQIKENRKLIMLSLGISIYAIILDRANKRHKLKIEQLKNEIQLLKKGE